MKADLFANGEIKGWHCKYIWASLNVLGKLGASHHAVIFSPYLPAPNLQVKLVVLLR